MLWLALIPLVFITSLTVVIGLWCSHLAGEYENRIKGPITRLLRHALAIYPYLGFVLCLGPVGLWYFVYSSQVMDIAFLFIIIVPRLLLIPVFGVLLALVSQVAFRTPRRKVHPFFKRG